MRRSAQERAMSSSYDTSSGRGLLACYAKAKPRPSKWDDAQRWLSSRALDDDRRRSSCADDRTLLPSASQKGRHSWSAADGAMPAALAVVGLGGAHDDAEAETKRMDSVLAYGGQERCLSLRDVGTEMTPGGSKEPSRANTPRAAAAAAVLAAVTVHAPRRRTASTTGPRDDRGSPLGRAATAREGADTEGRKNACGTAPTAAVSPATAWDAAERAKHMARYRREEMKIQAWENRRRQKAELQMKMTEAKADKMKLRAEEKTASKLATAQTVARERRARAEAKLNQRAARVGNKADVLRKSGRLPFSVFSLKLPLMCS